MAKNFLDQAFSLLGLKSPNATDYYDPSVYRTEASNSEITSSFSSIEQYQQKITAATDTEAKELSGVAKYLAAKQGPEEEQISTVDTTDTTEKKLTGVAKYLSTKYEEQAALESMTGVAKYLFHLKTDNKKTPSKNTSAEKKAPLTKLSRVDMYIAKQKDPAFGKHAAKVSKKIPTEDSKIPPKDNLKKEATPRIKQQEKTQTKKEKPTQILEKITNEIIDLTEGVTQCQAATLKHTQCSRKTSLETIVRTINKQQYKFTVCSQHNIDSFTPFENLLQED